MLGTTFYKRTELEESKAAGVHHILSLFGHLFSGGGSSYALGFLHTSGSYRSTSVHLFDTKTQENLLSQF